MISTLVLQYKPTMAFCYIFYSITHLSKALHGLLDEVSHTHSAAHAEHMPQHIMEHTGSFGFEALPKGKTSNICTLGIYSQCQWSALWNPAQFIHHTTSNALVHRYGHLRHTSVSTEQSVG